MAVVVLHWSFLIVRTCQMRTARSISVTGLLGALGTTLPAPAAGTSPSLISIRSGSFVSILGLPFRRCLGGTAAVWWILLCIRWCGFRGCLPAAKRLKQGRENDVFILPEYMIVAHVGHIWHVIGPIIAIIDRSSEFRRVIRHLTVIGFVGKDS